MPSAATSTPTTTYTPTADDFGKVWDDIVEASNAAGLSPDEYLSQTYNIDPDALHTFIESRGLDTAGLTTGDFEFPVEAGFILGAAWATNRQEQNS